MENHLPLLDRGIFIVVEGPDGVGKTTIINRLVELLDNKLTNLAKTFNLPHNEGQSFCLSTCAMRATHTSRAITDIFLSKDYAMSDWTRSLLAAAARTEAALEIQIGLQQRKVVICNRWLDSTIIYQNGVPEEIHESIHYNAVDPGQEVEPDIRIIITAKEEIIFERLLQRKQVVGLDALEDVERDVVRRRIHAYNDLCLPTLAGNDIDLNTYVYDNSGTLDELEVWLNEFVNDAVISDLESVIVEERSAT